MDFDYEKVSIEEARRALDGNDRVERGQEVASMRLPQATKETLLSETVTWMAQLPRTLRPFNLATQYPRIANEICRRWKLSARCEAYIKELLIVDRDGQKRQGFPPLVASEIAALACHHLESLPQAKNRLA